MSVAQPAGDDAAGGREATTYVPAPPIMEHDDGVGAACCRSRQRPQTWMRSSTMIAGGACGWTVGNQSFARWAGSVVNYCCCYYYTNDHACIIGRDCEYYGYGYGLSAAGCVATSTYLATRRGVYVRVRALLSCSCSAEKRRHLVY